MSFARSSLELSLVDVHSEPPAADGASRLDLVTDTPGAATASTTAATRSTAT